jgi:hypothetical protein
LHFEFVCQTKAFSKRRASDFNPDHTEKSFRSRPRIPQESAKKSAEDGNFSRKAPVILDIGSGQFSKKQQYLAYFPDHG